MVAADIDADAILRPGFLKANYCQLNLDRGILAVKTKVCLKVEGKIGCYRIIFSENVEILSRSEAFIQGKFQIPPFCSNDLAIVEPTKNPFFLEGYSCQSNGAC